MERRKERGDRGEGGEAAGRKRSLPPSTLMTPPKPLALPLVSHFLNETITAAEAVASLARSLAPLRLSPARRVWNGNIISAMTAAAKGDTEEAREGLGWVTETAGHSLGRQRDGVCMVRAV